MDMISHLPLELRVEIFKRFVDLRALSKDMKTELQSTWFNLFYDKALKLIEDHQYDQSINIVLFLHNTVIEQDIKINDKIILKILRILVGRKFNIDWIVNSQRII